MRRQKSSKSKVSQIIDAFELAKRNRDEEQYNELATALRKEYNDLCNRAYPLSFEKRDLKNALEYLPSVYIRIYIADPSVTQAWLKALRYAVEFVEKVQNDPFTVEERDWYKDSKRLLAHCKLLWIMQHAAEQKLFTTHPKIFLNNRVNDDADNFDRALHYLVVMLLIRPDQHGKFTFLEYFKTVEQRSPNLTTQFQSNLQKLQNAFDEAASGRQALRNSEDIVFNQGTLAQSQPMLVNSAYPQSQPMPAAEITSPSLVASASALPVSSPDPLNGANATKEKKRQTLRRSKIIRLHEDITNGATSTAVTTATQASSASVPAASPAAKELLSESLILVADPISEPAAKRERTSDPVCTTASSPASAPATNNSSQETEHDQAANTSQVTIAAPAKPDLSWLKNQTCLGAAKYEFTALTQQLGDQTNNLKIIFSAFDNGLMCFQNDNRQIVSLLKEHILVKAQGQKMHEDIKLSFLIYPSQGNSFVINAGYIVELFGIPSIISDAPREPEEQPVTTSLLPASAVPTSGPSLFAGSPAVRPAPARARAEVRIEPRAKSAFQPVNPDVRPPPLPGPAIPFTRATTQSVRQIQILPSVPAYARAAMFTAQVSGSKPPEHLQLTLFREKISAILHLPEELVERYLVDKKRVPFPPQDPPNVISLVLLEKHLLEIYADVVSYFQSENSTRNEAEITLKQLHEGLSLPESVSLDNEILWCLLRKEPKPWKYIVVDKYNSSQINQVERFLANQQCILPDDLNKLVRFARSWITLGWLVGGNLSMTPASCAPALFQPLINRLENCQIKVDDLVHSQYVANFVSCFLFKAHRALMIQVAPAAAAQLSAMQRAPNPAAH